MSQRNSEYKRIDADFYPTPEWVTEALITHCLDAGRYPVWECAYGDGAMANVLSKYGMVTISDIRDEDETDFLKQDLIPSQCNSIITNPPFRLAENFIRHALELTKPVNGMVAMLLRIDFDSAKTRRDIFEDCRAWGTKLVLTKRIKWFENPKGGSPSENHAWYIWDWSRDIGRLPNILYHFEK